LRSGCSSRVEKKLPWVTSIFLPLLSLAGANLKSALTSMLVLLEGPLKWICQHAEDFLHLARTDVRLLAEEIVNTLAIDGKFFSFFIHASSFFCRSLAVQGLRTPYRGKDLTEHALRLADHGRRRLIGGVHCVGELRVHVNGSWARPIKLRWLASPSTGLRGFVPTCLRTSLLWEYPSALFSARLPIAWTDLKTLSAFQVYFLFTLLRAGIVCGMDYPFHYDEIILPSGALQKREGRRTKSTWQGETNSGTRIRYRVRPDAPAVGFHDGAREVQSQALRLWSASRHSSSDRNGRRYAGCLSLRCRVLHR
jgi:hypothetical protein